MSSEATLLLIVILAIGAALAALWIGLSVCIHRKIGEAIRDGKEFREREAVADGPQRIWVE